jgi:hypothetical protein
VQGQTTYASFIVAFSNTSITIAHQLLPEAEIQKQKSFPRNMRESVALSACCWRAATPRKYLR